MMRWIVLALSLGAAIVSIIHGGFALLLSSSNAQSVVSGSSGGTFTWVTGIMLFVSAALALLGGTLVFNTHRIGGFFLAVAASACLFINSDTRVYGALYLVAGIMSFFVRRDLDDDYEKDDEGDGLYDYPDDQADDEDDLLEEVPQKSAPEPSRPRTVSHVVDKKEHVAKIRQRNEEEKNGYGKGDTLMSLNQNQVRARSSKVCPACGASVGMDHKFCFVCGGPLHTRGTPEAEQPVTPSVERAESFEKNEPAVSFRLTEIEEFGAPQPLSDKLQTDERVRKIPQNFNPIEEDSFDDENDPFEEGEDEEEQVEIGTPHKVFVKPIKDEGPVPKRPFVINPDSSYQEFSNYARRRKRRRNSLLRRVFAPLFLLLLVGGTSWFLLGLRKLPPEDLPVRPSPVQPGTEEAQQKPEPSSKDMAVPDGGGQGIDARDALSALRIESPARGLIVGSNVNLRTDHTTSAQVVTRLSSEVRGEILERWEGTTGNLTGTWFRVRAADKEGWIFGRYFQPLDSRALSMPTGYAAALLKAFGAGKTEAQRILGRPTKSTASSLAWAGLTVTYRGEDATKAQISGAKHVLPNGVGVGVTDEVLFGKMGYPSEYRSGQLIYLEAPGRGVAVRMKDGKIQSIVVGEL